MALALTMAQTKAIAKIQKPIPSPNDVIFSGRKYIENGKGW